MSSLYAAIAVLVLALGGWGWLERQSAHAAADRAAMAEAALLTARETLTSATARAKSLSAANLALNQQKAILNDQLTKNLRTLDGLRNRSICLNEPVGDELAGLLARARAGGGEPAAAP